MNETELIWFAGFFDGEGCICLNRGKGKRVQGYVGVSQKDPMPLLRTLRLTFDLGWRRPDVVDSHSGTVTLTWRKGSGCAVLRSLLPYLCPLNVERAGIYLQAFSSYRGKGCWGRGGTPVLVLAAQDKALEKHKQIMLAKRNLNPQMSLAIVQDEANILWCNFQEEGALL